MNNSYQESSFSQPWPSKPRQSTCSSVGFHSSASLDHQHRRDIPPTWEFADYLPEPEPGTSEIYGGCQKLRRRCPRILRRMWSCWWPHVQSGRCATYTLVGTWNFKEYWNSYGRQMVALCMIFHSRLPREKQRAHAVANVFSGGVATNDLTT